MDAERDPGKLHIGHRKRIKARYLERGLEAMDDRDVLELLLTYAIPRKDVYEKAYDLVSEFGSVTGVLEADFNDLVKKGKLSEHTAILLKLVGDIKSREFRLLEYKKERLTSLVKTVEYCYGILSRFNEEVLIEIFLNKDNRIVDLQHLGFGTSDTVVLPTDTILIKSSRVGVKNVLLAHNHPSGSSAPSSSDIVSTEALRKALRLRGMDLLEHIIVSRDECTAMLHHQYFKIKNGKAHALDTVVDQGGDAAPDIQDY